MSVSSDVATARDEFNRSPARYLAGLVDPSAVPAERAADASSRFAYFETPTRFIVVSGPQEGAATELALVYGLALREGLGLILVLPRKEAAVSAIRAAWLDVLIEILVYDEPGAVEPFALGDRQTILEMFGSPSFVDTIHHLGDRASWVEPLTVWAGANSYLAPAHRPDNRSWHCRGLRVLRIARTPEGVAVRAGIDYTEADDKPAAAITLNLTAPLTEAEVDLCQERVGQAIDERYWDEGSMYKADEHWLQAVLREEPALAGVETPVLREVPALRCTGTGTDGAPTWSRGYIDLLGADPQGSIRLIETKLGSYDLLVLQGLDYYIWAQRHHSALARKLSLPDDAPLELHFVVGGRKGGSPSLSRYVAAQLEALAEDIPWRVHFIEDWFGNAIADVSEVYRHDAVGTFKEAPTPASAPDVRARAMTAAPPTAEASWADPRLHIASDSARTARYRALQSWYREKVLGVPPGRDRRGRVIASMLPEEVLVERPGLNFITPEAAAYASERAGDVLRTGGTLDEDRLRRNMLSSMPMCFTIFGSLRYHPELGVLVSGVFDLEVSSVDGVECEWAPERTAHLNDRTAFDAFVTYRDPAGRRCFLAVETKYTEPFSQKEYDSDLYRQVTAGSGYFREGASEHLIGRATNQMWRMTMLAASMLHRGEFEAGAVRVLSLADDRHARTAVEGVRAQVVDEALVKFVSLEKLVEAASDHDGLRTWSRDFATRYLDLGPVMSGG